MKRKLFLWILLSSLVSVIHGFSQDAPLTEAEIREAAGRLAELRFARKEIELQRKSIDRDAEQDRKEAELHAKELDLARQRQQLTEQELGIWKEKAASFEQAYQIALKANKKSFGCKMKKIFTFGLAGCG